jgi:hypothetical protein
MDSNTQITSKKYKTIGNLLKAPIKSIIIVANNEPNKIIQEYLYDWLYENYYSKKSMIGNLTMRIKNIGNKCCYNYLMKNVFNNTDILNKNKTTENILTLDCINIIKQLHSIEPSLTGVYLDYLLRRIICELINKNFNDSRSDHQDIELMINNLSISIKECYKKAKDITLYKSQDILVEIFITSLSHTYAFGGIPNEDKLKTILEILQNTTNFIEIFFIPLKILCSNIIKNNTDILLNPALGGYEIPQINASIPSDCDLVVNNTLFDIKCTKGDNSIYEIFQLLGYSSLLNNNQRYNKHIDNIQIINLLQGFTTNYDISYITNEEMINYLRILTHENKEKENDEYELLQNIKENDENIKEKYYKTPDEAFIAQLLLENHYALINNKKYTKLEEIMELKDCGNVVNMISIC